MADKTLNMLHDLIVGIMKPSIEDYFRFLEWDDDDEFIPFIKSIIVNQLLKELLVDTNSGYLSVESWSGIVRDADGSHSNTYAHAWVYCIHTDPNKNLFIDIGIDGKAPLCIYSRQNEYPTELSGYENFYVQKKNEMILDSSFKTLQEVLNRPTDQIIQEIKSYMSRQEVTELI